MTPEEHIALVGLTYDELDGLFTELAGQLKNAFKFDLEIDPSLLANVSESFAYDIGRYLAFHEIQIPDRARRGAYLCKWVMRFRPVYLKSDITALPDNSRRLAFLANELFATYALSGIMKIDLATELSDRMFNIMLYSLRYRAHSEDSFILFLAYLCKLE